MKHLSRREFSFRLAAVTLFLWLRPLRSLANSPKKAAIAFNLKALKNKLLQIFPSWDGISEIGEKYLLEHPGLSGETLTQEILGLDGLSPYTLRLHTQRGLRTWYLRQVAADFRLRRVVQLDRWTLSRTEVLLAALRALKETP